MYGQGLPNIAAMTGGMLPTDDGMGKDTITNSSRKGKRKKAPSTAESLDEMKSMLGLLMEMVLSQAPQQQPQGQQQMGQPQGQQQMGPAQGQLPPASGPSLYGGELNGLQ